MVERRNQVMEKFLDVAQSKGNITDLSDLDMYCAAATAACNLEYGMTLCTMATRS